MISIITIIAYLFLTNQWYIEFSEECSVETKIEYGQDINIREVQAYLKGKNFLKNGLELKVITTDNINETKIGSYEVKYSASCLFISREMTNVYNIVDTTPPEIKLETKEGHYTIVGDEYKEEGFTAYDNYDGDITDNVRVYIDKNIAHYTVSDSSGNSATVTRDITYIKPIPPILSLLGDKTKTIKQGGVYIEPGFLATDFLGYSLTEKVIIESNVDTKTPGQYEIKYTVEDDYGNSVTEIRTIIVESNKVIYLTFDDGPGPYTRELLDILNKHDVKATFFVVGSAYQDVITDIYNEGHSIGIHSLTHDYKNIYSSEEAYFDDLYKMQEIIYEKTGYYTNLVRFPGGSSNTVSKNYNEGIMTRLSQQLLEKGFQFFDWNVSSGDAGEVWTKEEVYQNVISGIGNKKVSIVLQHDIKKYSVDAVEDIIIWGKENGYTFLPLDINSPAYHHGINN